MSIDREELKRLIDLIPDQDAVEVHDFIGYLNMKREREVLEQLDVSSLEEDKNLVRQVEQSREDRKNGRIYGKEAGLDYLRSKVKDFENEQNI